MLAPAAIVTGSKVRTNVRALDRLRRGLEPKTDILVPPLLLGDDLLADYKSSLYEPPATHAKFRLGCKNIPRAFAFWKMDCFWNAFSIWQHNEISERFSRSKYDVSHLVGHGWVLRMEAVGPACKLSTEGSVYGRLDSLGAQATHQ